MTLDWNWFFSTLSQSTAAIVGIVGAFIIAKIFSNQSVFSEKNNKMNTLIIESQKLLDKIGTINFAWYIRECNDAAYRTAANDIASIKDEDELEHNDATLLEIYEAANFSEFSEKGPILDKLREEVAHHCSYLLEKRLREERRQEDQERRAKGELDGLSGLTALFGGFAPHLNTRTSMLNFSDIATSPWVAMNKERDLITECFLEVKHHARVVGDFVESVKDNPESPPQITWSLAFVALIFLAGVIYPLTFMPSGTPPTHALSFAELVYAFLSVKGALLSLLSLAFMFIISMFMFTNHSMKYKASKVSQLETLSDANNYSDYFKYL
ncbi:hypothetical protein [Pseudomonas sp. A-B-19]|uniref:hypothetical protein n=1 Tax=Pseudomonas sp. A-B-19 TaxID=2832405 RepID=UPI001CBE8294|nr:hypothetical protein [Pseudomonas sp. A-B-19]